MSQRIDWVDRAKAMGIFLMLLGHHRIDEPFIQYIYSFHMPLFFFLSGFLFDPFRHPAFGPFALRRVRTLLVPYAIFATLSYLFWLLVVRSVSIHGESLAANPWLPLYGIFASIGWSEWQNPLDTALWFLPCLFLVELLFWTIARCARQRSAMIAALILCSAAGYVGSHEMPFRLPWSADVAICAVTLYGAGYLLRRPLAQFLNGVNPGKILLIAVLLGIGGYLAMVNSRVDMYRNQYGDLSLFYLAALTNTVGWLGIAAMIPRSEKLLPFVGSNTLAILGLSGVSFFVIRGLFYVSLHVYLGRDPLSLGAAALLSVLQILLLVPVFLFLNRFLPVAVGRSSR